MHTKAVVLIIIVVIVKSILITAKIHKSINKRANNPSMLAKRNNHLNKNEFVKQKLATTNNLGKRQLKITILKMPDNSTNTTAQQAEENKKKATQKAIIAKKLLLMKKLFFQPKIIINKPFEFREPTTTELDTTITEETSKQDGITILIKTRGDFKNLNDIDKSDGKKHFGIRQFGNKEFKMNYDPMKKIHMQTKEIKNKYHANEDRDISDNVINDGQKNVDNIINEESAINFENKEKFDPIKRQSEIKKIESSDNDDDDDNNSYEDPSDSNSNEDDDNNSAQSSSDSDDSDDDSVNLRGISKERRKKRQINDKALKLPIGDLIIKYLDSYKRAISQDLNFQENNLDIPTDEKINKNSMRMLTDNSKPFEPKTFRDTANQEIVRKYILRPLVKQKLLEGSIFKKRNANSKISKSVIKHIAGRDAPEFVGGAEIATPLYELSGESRLSKEKPRSSADTDLNENFSKSSNTMKLPNFSKNAFKKISPYIEVEFNKTRLTEAISKIVPQVLHKLIKTEPEYFIKIAIKQ